jgi:hypothetical protein
LDRQNNLGRHLPGAGYVHLPGVNKGNQISEGFRNALKEFFRKRPELIGNQQLIELMKYCYIHYINFDPQFRDLTLTEKLEQASRMAADFFGTMYKR